MSEATLQARLAAALKPLVADGSVLINDYHTPQVASVDSAPWIILETADDLSMTTGSSFTTPSITYQLYVKLLDYRGGRTENEFVDDFQALRQSVLATLAGLPEAPNGLWLSGAATAGPLEPFLRETGEPDPDSLTQRLSVEVMEDEV